MSQDVSQARRRKIRIHAWILAFGIVMVVASLLPWGDSLKQSMWTEEDSQNFAAVSAEFHRLSYESAERTELSVEQLQSQTERAKAQFEALEAKLQNAQNRPLIWKRFFLWSGVVVTVAGAVTLLASDRS